MKEVKTSKMPTFPIAPRQVTEAPDNQHYNQHKALAMGCPIHNGSNSKATKPRK